MAELFPILENLFLTASTGKMQTISGTQFCGQQLKLDLAKSLDENRACVESKESNRQKTALHGAAIYGHVSTVQLLLEKGASIEARECSDRTALYFAAKNGHEVTVRLLLDKGADTESKSDYGYRDANEYESTVHPLIENGPKIE
jgi:ankyrin repeat protein